MLNNTAEAIERMYDERRRSTSRKKSEMVLNLGNLAHEKQSKCPSRDMSLSFIDMPVITAKNGQKEQDLRQQNLLICIQMDDRHTVL